MKKPIWKSKTLWGIVLTLLQILLAKNGIEIPVVGDFGTYLTEGLAVYGLRDAIGKST